MARRPKPWFRSDRGAWYCQWKGEQYRLADGEANEGEAWAALARLLGEGEARPIPELRVNALFVEYLAKVERETESVTFGNYERVLQRFTTSHGARPAATLRPFDLTGWLDSLGRLRPATRNTYTTIIKQAFRWAEVQGLIEQDPLRHARGPIPGRREVILTERQARTILATAPEPEFRDYVRALWETGCRPGEARRLTADQVDLRAGVWTVKNKTRRKGDPTRSVYLSARMVELSRELIDRHPEGHLFRSPQGQPFSETWVERRFQRIRKTLGYGPECTAYSFRHLFITDALERGVPIATVAELVGHRSTAMIMRVYSKLSERTQHLREAVAKVRPG